MLKYRWRKWDNPTLRKFIDSQETEHDKAVVVETLNFFKAKFPSCKKELRGKLIEDEYLK